LPDPPQFDHRVVYRVGHQANLAFFAFLQDKADQAVRAFVPD
jgi:hypothetical protein